MLDQIVEKANCTLHAYNMGRQAYSLLFMA